MRRNYITPRRIVIGWLVAFGGIFLGIAATLFIAGVLNQSYILSFSTIPFFVLSLLCAFESARRIISESDFKKRIAQYIVDGKVLQKNGSSYETSDEYEKIANDWVNKVVSDIRKHRGQSEANLFLVQWQNQSASMVGWRPKDIEDTKRHETQNMLSSRIGWLEWLQMRL